ncbi:MAG: hypothetical protein WCE75_00740 [Terracidiphilus sp.]
MKKFVFASVMALASISLVSAPTLRAQDLTIKDPAEFNAYQMASTQSDLKAKASALEDFLQRYPQSVVKKAVLLMLVESYQGLNNNEQTASAASRALQVDPNNMEAIFAGALAKKALAGHSQNPGEVLDDAALLARKGLAVPKPADVSADDWKKQTDAAYPVFHSVLAYDAMVSKKDPAAAAKEFTAELMIVPPDQTKSGPALNDTLQLAEAYAAEKPADMVNAVWFYARAFAYAPDSYKPVIEKKLKYWYNKFHGGLDGLDDIKAKARDTVFPAGIEIKAAPTPAEIAHTALTGGDPKSLNLGDKEFILANGVKADQDALWALLKDQATPVPGVVIEASATTIKVAVTDDAKTAKIADFVVNLKKPLEDKDIPAAGTEFKLQPAGEIDGTYDSYTTVPATATTLQGVQIVLRDGVVVPEKKKAVPVHKPAAGHRPAAH